MKSKDELFVKPISKQEKRKGDYWAKLRVRKEKDGLQYFDILTGKNHEEYEHLGIYLNGSRKFSALPNEKNPRNQIHTIHRKIESEFHGTLIDERKQLKNTKPQIDLKFKTKINVDSGEVYVSTFDFEIL